MKINQYQCRSLVMTVLVFISASVLGADTYRNQQRSATAPGSAMFYNSFAVNFGLHGYTSALVPARVLSPTVSYQNLAYGPAIYSYPQLGDQLEIAWNVIYVSPAHGQIIYGYPGVGDEPEDTGRGPSIIIE